MMIDIDIARVRADTPGCDDVVHLNNAGCALRTRSVLDAQIDYLTDEALLGGYETEDGRGADLARFAEASGALLGADPTEMGFTSGASEAWWRAFSAVPLVPGDRVLAGRAEFVSGAVGLLQARRRGIDVQFVPDDATGRIDLDVLASMLDERVKLVCLTQLPMTNGLINPAAEVGALAKAVGAYYLLDACQALGQLPVDVDELQCDFLTGTGRKWLRGPRGTGLLYARQSSLGELNDPVFVDGRSADWFAADDYRPAATAQRFEFGEFSFADKVALGVAIEYALAIGIDAIARRVGSLAELARDRLRATPDVVVHDVGVERSGIVTFNLLRTPAAEVTTALRKVGVNTAAPQARTSRLDLDRTGVDSVVRVSPHYYNTEAEIDRFADALASLVGVGERSR